MKASSLIRALLLALALTLTAPAFAQPAPAPSEGTTFKSEDALPSATPLDRCIRDNIRLTSQVEKDVIGVPHLAAGYIAFFLILVVFIVLAGMRQRKLEAEMTELRTRLAKLQEGK